MEKAPLIEPLLEKAEQYSKVIFELVKLKSLAKAADISSTIVSRSVFAIVLTLFAFTLTIGVSLWVGELLGKNYYGFLAVSAFYGFIGLVVYFMHPFIKSRMHNSFVSHMLN